MAYDDQPAWARRLRQARVSRGWSQRKLAQKLEERADATDRVLPARESLVRMIRGWEAGDHLPEPFHRWLLAQVLNVAEEELFERTDATLVVVSAGGFSSEQWGLLARLTAALQRLNLRFKLGAGRRRVLGQWPVTVGGHRVILRTSEK